MRFSLSPPPPKAVASAATSPTYMQARANDQRTSGSGAEEASADDAASDYIQWLHAMKLVARLPGGMPPEFRRKLWLSLADKYLKSKNVDWTKEEEKCFCEKWREDDEELGIQIVKDLHRTGSNLCTGPAGSINQAKLKRILLGYARYNPEVGYCQGFNMLGALILQVMDKEESESMKVMIYLVEGVLPTGYFCGSMGGLQADMGVFRDLMQTKLPRLAKHLQKLQGPVENAFEPPLTNVFTMQWFLTMFCTCLPMTCVLRVWDLVLIEGSDVLLRTALVLWSLLEERVLNARTADDFYCKMGSFSSELLNGHLIDSNGLIEKVVQLGPIPDIQKLRDKHLYNIAPLRHKQGLQLYFDDEEPESDEESRLAVATVWGLPWGRRGSQGQSTTTTTKHTPENKDRIALDISLLKKQYDRLRERQKQAHIILTTACSTARQAPTSNQLVPVNQLLMGRSAIVTNKGRRVGPPPGAIPPARKPSLPTVLQTKHPEKQLRRGETLHWRDTDLTKRRRDSLTWKEIKADRSSSLVRQESEVVQPTIKLRSRMGKSDSSSYSEESDGEGSSTDTSLCDEDDPASTGDKTRSSSIENSPKRRSKSGRKQKDLPSKLQNLAVSRDSSKERKRPKSWAPSTHEIPFMLMTSDSPVHSGDEQSALTQPFSDILKEEEDSATESDRMGYKRVKDLNWSVTKYSPIAGDLATAAKLEALHVQTDVLVLPDITSTSQLSPMPDISTYLNNSSISPLPTPKPLFLDSTNSLGSGDGDDAKKFDVSDDGVTNQYFERVNSVERPNKLELFYSLNEEDGIRKDEIGEDGELKCTAEHKTDASEPSYKTEFIFKPDTDGKGEEFEPQITVKIATSFDEKDDPGLNRRMEILMDYSEKSSAAYIAEATSELSTAFKKDKLRNEEEKRLELQMACQERDNNIPGENRDDFKESTNKSNDADSFVIKTAQLNRKHSLNNASKKRRDPRRLTLTRSSTIDIEERFQDLERRLSVEISTKEATNLKEIDGKENCSNNEMHKTIPSTEDLEKRFHTLEKQLSASKAAQNRPPSISEDITNDNDEIMTCSHMVKEMADSDTDPPTKTVRARIPSTADLESRYNALEKKMSSNSLTTKNAIDLKGNEKDESVVGKTNESKSNENEEKAAEKEESEAGIKGESVDEPIESTDESEKPRLTKLPSTAELEDRFNVLERKKNVQKSSPSKSKKEPPDGQESEDQENVEPEIKTVNLKSGETSDQEKASEIKKPEVKIDTKSESGSSKAERPRLTKLPSTAELEDRFNELERQKSLQKSSPTNGKKVEKEALDNDENKTETSKRSGNGGEQIDNANTKMVVDEVKQEPKENKNIENTKITPEKNKSVDIEEKNVKREDEKVIESTKNVQRSEEFVATNDETLLENSTESVKPESTTPTRKKSPPSTEELEKRFKALEKQLSTTSVEGAVGGNEKQSTLKLSKETEKPTEIKEVSTNVSKDSEPMKSEEQAKKSMKSFEEKCSAINKKIIEESDRQEISSSGEQVKSVTEVKQLKSMQSFSEKCKSINKQLVKEDERIEGEKAESLAQELEKRKEERSMSKRRASEPPTTEDLEKRYESLKRRMSSKIITEKPQLTKSETVDEALERIEKEVIEETVEVVEANEMTTERDQEKSSSKQPETGVKKKSSEPPSTEDLESRYEALQRRSSTKPEKPLSIKPKELKCEEVDVSRKKVETAETVLASPEAPLEQTHHIPDAPPMPLAEMSNIYNKSSPSQRRALIEEFQSKIKSQPNDENLKPSDINPNRKRPPEQRASPKVDETSEAHADTAFYRSGNYEPWLTQPNRMVRRFSDLPSRSDLENRLQFLEKQLSKKFYKQRCASDSEVASRRHFVGVQNLYADDDIPSTSQRQQRSSGDLENRVQALEKQLSENSLKLLEAMRVKTPDVVAESESPRRLSTETLDGTGKELVKYTHFGELEETESHKPINISINIKMLLNKDGSDDRKRKTESLPTTEELEKRLEILEEQIRASKARHSESVDKEGELKSKELSVDLKSSEEKKIQTEKELQSNGGEKVRKDIVNEDVKYEEKESEQKVELQIVNDDIKCEEVPEDNKSKIKTETKKEVTKAEKTIENQEIARSQKSAAEDKVSEKKVETKEKEVQEKKMESRVEENKTEEEAAAKKMESETRAIKMEPEKKEIKESNKDNYETHLNQKENTNQVSIDKPEAKPSTNESTNEKITENPISNQLPDNVVINATDGLEPVDPNNKTMVLLLDNEPKAVKVRRLTRANTEELEGLFQALEKQLSDRNLIKTEDGKLKRADSKPEPENKKPSDESKAISDLTKEIEEFTSGEKDDKKPKVEEYDWGIDPVKRHLKRKTVYLPSTKELESRFRSLERQIKLLEDVEKIDVEQRLNEIERKIKLQYSLSHEKDLNKYLELCEGKGLDDIPDITPTAKSKNESPHNSPARSRAKSPYTSPSRVKEKTPHTSPSRTQDYRSPYTSPSRSTKRSPYTSPTHAQNHRSPYTSPSRSSKRSPGPLPYEEDSSIPSTEDLEYRYRALNLTRSKSKESLDGKSKRKVEPKKQPIHRLEMLLDPSPDDSDIPSTGELEHRMRVLDETRRTPSPSPPPQRRSRNRSPTIDDMKRQKTLDQQRPRKPIHNLETLVVSPTRRELPTADELDARMRALEDDHSFDRKMQKNFKEFNQKLKDAISPSLSFEEFSAPKSREESPRRSDYHRPTTPKSALRDRESESRRDECRYRSTSPKVIRFRDSEEYRPKSWTGQHDTERMVGNADGVLQIIEENSKMLHRILKKTLADSSSSFSGTSVSEGLDEMGTRLMRETSPITRTGTHTGITLRTDDNINDRLNSIKNTIKSIDTLCEEKPYHKEKCQRYIDSLFSGSVHFANPPSKKTSHEDLTRSESRSRREYAPSIRVSDHSQRPSEYFLSRSVGSAESIHTSPLRAASPLHRSNRDIRRDTSPRRRRDEEREEYESRVRRENMLPNYIHDNHSALSSGSLTKFHKVDRQLDTYKYDERERSSSRSASRSPLRSPYGSREMTMMLPPQPPPHHNHNTTANTFTTTATNSNRFDLDRPVSPYRQTSHNLLGYDSLKRSTTPVYAPAKLDIRHTTVTSTFYDRLLTEKHIEKTLSRPPSRSPVVSPSVTSKSYLDIPVASGGGTNNAKSSNENSPTTPRVHSIVGGTTGFGNEGNYTSMPSSYASSTYNAVTPLPLPLQYSATTPTGNCSTTYQTALLTRLPPLAATDASSHIDLRIRSCDNILMQLKSTSYATTAGAATPPLTANSSSLLSTTTTTTTSSVATTTSYISTSLYNPSAINSFSSNIIATTTNSSSNIFNTSLYSTGVYNPLMPLTMRQPSSDMGISLGQYTSTLNNNTPAATHLNSATELPKI